MQFVRPTSWKAAVDKLGSKTPIGSALNSSEWAQVPIALRERAFFSSEVESIRFLQRSRDAIADFLGSAREILPNGNIALKVGSRAEFVKQMSELAIREGMGPLDAHDAGTIKDVTSEGRLGLIFDVQNQSAQDYTFWKQGMDPDVLNEFPAQRFIREREVKVPRPYHQLNERRVELKTNLEFWLSMNQDFGVPWGPWGYNSGMGVEDVDRDEAERLGLIQPGEKIEPAVKEFNDHLQASTQGLDEDMIAKLKESFGDQIEIDGDSIKWKGTEPAHEEEVIPTPQVDEEPEPTPAPLPVLEPTTTTIDEVLTQLDLDSDRRVTADDMTKLLDELKESEPMLESQVIKSVAGDKPSGIFEESRIRESVQEFLNFIPAKVARKLPKLEIKVVREYDSYGSYAPGGRFKLSTLLEGRPEKAKETIFHELMHWVHREGPQEYRTAIKKHFEERTAGERIRRLPGYSKGTNGKTDKWYEPYAGRIYSFEVTAEGLEIPTRYIEWLTFKPEEMAAHWNDPNFRETMKIVLKGLF